MSTTNPSNSRRTQTIEPSNPSDNWCSIEAICGESRRNYRVLWEGLDPETGLPWSLQWVSKRDVTLDCINEWKAWKALHPDLKYRDLSIYPFDDAYAPSQNSQTTAGTSSQYSASGVSATSFPETSTNTRRRIAAHRIILSSQSDLGGEPLPSTHSSFAVPLVTEPLENSFVAVQAPPVASDILDLPYFSQTQKSTQSSTSQRSLQADTLAGNLEVPDSQAITTLDFQRFEIDSAGASVSGAGSPSIARPLIRDDQTKGKASLVSSLTECSSIDSSQATMSDPVPVASDLNMRRASPGGSQPTGSAPPNIVETQPTPPGSSEAYHTSQFSSTRPPRSPSPSQLRNRAQSPAATLETPIRKISDLQNAELTVPLPLLPDVKKTYGEQIKWAYQQGRLGDLIGTSTEISTHFDFEVAADVATRLLSLALHPDLMLSQDDLSQHPADQFAKYSESVSSKFAFLASLFGSLRGKGKQIAVIVTDGSPKMLLEQFLQGIGAQYRHTVREESGLTRLDEPCFTIFDHESSVSSDQDPFDLVIGLDHNFSFDAPLPRQCRQLSSSRQRKCLVIHLVVPFSMEHILGPRSPRDMNANELKQAFTLAIKAGPYLRNLPIDRLAPTMVAREVATNISQDIDDDVSLLPLLEDYPIPLHLRPPPSEEPSVSLKRRADDLINEENTTKRPRSATPAQNSALRNDVTHVTDTTMSSGVASRVVANPPASNRATNLELDSLQTIIQELESGNKQLNVENAEMRKQLAKAAAIELRSERVQETNDSLRGKNRQYEADLVTARALHAQSANPDVRELEELRQAASRVTQLEKDLQATKQTLEYITARYHEVEQSASEFKDAITELEQNNRALQAKVEGEARLAQEAMAQTMTMANTTGMKKANKEKELMEDLLHRKDAEIAALKDENEKMKDRLGAGISTRASARANSPAMGSRVGTPVGGTSMSRAGSRSGTPQPVPGGARSGLKLNMGPSTAHRSHLRE